MKRNKTCADVVCWTNRELSEPERFSECRYVIDIVVDIGNILKYFVRVISTFAAIIAYVTLLEYCTDTYMENVSFNLCGELAQKYHVHGWRNHVRILPGYRLRISIKPSILACTRFEVHVICGVMHCNAAKYSTLSLNRRSATHQTHHTRKYPRISSTQCS